LAVKEVYKAAVEGRSDDEGKIIFGRITEALVKGVWIFGMPRMLNAFYPLEPEVNRAHVPEHTPRENMKNPLDYTERGLKQFRTIWGLSEGNDYFLRAYDIAPELRNCRLVLQLMLGQLGIYINYGAYVSDVSVLSAVETSQIVIASLLPLDVPQVKGHMIGLQRNGGTKEQAFYAVDIAETIARAMGINLTIPIPSADEIEV